MKRIAGEFVAGRTVWVGAILIYKDTTIATWRQQMADFPGTFAQETLVDGDFCRLECTGA